MTSFIIHNEMFTFLIILIEIISVSRQKIIDLGVLPSLGKKSSGEERKRGGIGKRDERKGERKRKG